MTFWFVCFFLSLFLVALSSIRCAYSFFFYMIKTPKHSGEKVRCLILHWLRFAMHQSVQINVNEQREKKNQPTNQPGSQSAQQNECKKMKQQDYKKKKKRIIRTSIKYITQCPLCLRHTHQFQVLWVIRAIIAVRWKFQLNYEIVR